MAVTTADTRRTRLLIARIVASVIMLAVLVWRVEDFDPWAVLPPRSASMVAWLLGALGLTLVAIGISAVRWKQVLLALGLEERWRRLTSIYFAGQFVSNVLPTTIGGDVLRVARLSRDNGETATTFASVVLERLSGWFVLPVITLTGLALNPGLRDLGRATTLAAAVAIATLAALSLLLLAVSDRRVGGRFTATEGWQRFAGAVHLGVTRFRARPAAAAAVLGVGLLYQLVLVGAASMAARALGIVDVGPTALLAFLPAVLIVQVLPIGIGGLGLREGALVVFLGPLGVSAEQAVALGLVLYALNMLSSVPGAPAFAFGARDGRPADVLA